MSVTLGDFSTIKVKKPSVSVTKKDIDAVFDQIKQQFTEWNATDKDAENGDRVVIDFEGFIDGTAFEGGKAEKHPLELGSNSFIPGFEEQLVGTKAGDDIEVKTTFPESYHVADMAGKEAVFKCHVHTVEVKKLPRMTEAFVKKITNSTKTLDQIKEDIEKDLLKQKKKEARYKLEGEILEQALALCTIEVHPTIVDKELDYIIAHEKYGLIQQGVQFEDYLKHQGKIEEEYKEERRPRALKQVQTRELLRAYVAEHQITAAHHEIDAKIEEQIARYKQPEQVEQVKKDFAKPERRKQIHDQITFEKAINVIVDKAIA
ncbi:MAG: trigger factor [Patescibacteria group bacterium]|nr:trigger factor [Patescibacteria group bacterium]